MTHDCFGLLENSAVEACCKQLLWRNICRCLSCR